MVYPEGLNGGFKPICVLLPKQSVWDTVSTNEPAMLQINLPSTTHGDMTMATSQQLSMPISSPHSVTECLSDQTQHGGRGRETLILHIVQHARTVSCTCFPLGDHHLWHPTLQQLARRKPPSNLEEIIAVYLKQSPPSPHESSQAGMADITSHSSCSPSP